MLQIEINQLLNQFAACKDVLVALGDETRIHIIMEMLKTASRKEHCEGMRALTKIPGMSVAKRVPFFRKKTHFALLI